MVLAESKQIACPTPPSISRCPNSRPWRMSLIQPFLTLRRHFISEDRRDKITQAWRFSCGAGVYGFVWGAYSGICLTTISPDRHKTWTLPIDATS